MRARWTGTPYFLRDGPGGNEWLPRRKLPGPAVPYAILPPAEMPHTVNRPGSSSMPTPTGRQTLDNNPLNTPADGGIYYLNVGYDGFRGRPDHRLVGDALAGRRGVTTAD